MTTESAFWKRARARLVPVIGESGFRILFARSLHLARREHAWLARTPVAAEEVFDDLQASFDARPRNEAQAADRALTGHFIALLHSLIGVALTGRLLDFHDAGPIHEATPGDSE